MWDTFTDSDEAEPNIGATGIQSGLNQIQD